MPLPLTVSCFSKIQIGFTFLVPAHFGSPGKRAVKQVCVRVLIQVHNFESFSARMTALDFNVVDVEVNAFSVVIVVTDFKIVVSRLVLRLWASCRTCCIHCAWLELSTRSSTRHIAGFHKNIQINWSCAE